MDKNNIGEMVQHDFLRQDSSALGRTINQFKKESSSFFGYNDHSMDINGKVQNIQFSSLKVHEKGFVGWSDTYEGIFLQHSLPKWPIMESNEEYTPPYSSFEEDLQSMQVTYSGVQLNPADKSRLSPFFNFYHGFFGVNLMSYYSRKKFTDEASIYKDNGVYGMSNEEDRYEETEDGESFIRSYKKNSRMIGAKKESFMKDAIEKNKIVGPFNPMAALMSPTKPTQHLFCTTLSQKDQFDELIKILFEMGVVRYLESITKASQGEFNKWVETHKFDEDVVINKDDVTLGSTKFFVATNRLIQIQNGKKKVKTYLDVWHSVEAKLDDRNKQMVISTWSSDYKDKTKLLERKKILFEETLQATISINELTETISWKGYSKQEHSKIGFILSDKKKDSDKWNVCLSGGNLYNREGRIKKSLVLCFKADGLNRALNGMRTKTVLEEYQEYDEGEEEDEEQEVDEKVQISGLSDTLKIFSKTILNAIEKIPRQEPTQDIQTHSYPPTPKGEVKRSARHEIYTAVQQYAVYIHKFSPKESDSPMKQYGLEQRFNANSPINYIKKFKVLDYSLVEQVVDLMSRRQIYCDKVGCQNQKELLDRLKQIIEIDPQEENQFINDLTTSDHAQQGQPTAQNDQYNNQQSLPTAQNYQQKKQNAHPTLQKQLSSDQQTQPTYFNMHTSKNPPGRPKKK